MKSSTDAMVGKLTEGTATDWAHAVIYTLINAMRSQCTVEPVLTPQLSIEPNEATRRRAAARADMDEMDHLHG